MDALISDFDNLKVSALTKSISINQFIHNVTIGPNSTFIEETKPESPKVQNKKKSPTNTIKSPTLTTNNKCTSRGKILTEIEAQVKDEVATKIRSRLEKIQDANKQLDAKLKSEWLKKQEYRIAQSQQQEQIMMQMLEEHDRKSLDHMQKLQQQYRIQAEERTKRNNEIKKREEEQRKLLQLIESFQKAQHVFRVEYQEIANILKEYNTPNLSSSNDPTKYSIVSVVSQKFRQYSEVIDKIKDKCKNGTITNTDLNVATNIVKESTKIKENMQMVLLKKKEEDAKQEEIRKNQPQITTPPVTTDTKQPVTTVVTTSTPDTPDSQQIQPQLSTINDTNPSISVIDTFSNKSALKMYTALSQYLETYKNSFSQLLIDPRMKQFRFNCQKAVNIPLNAISAVNMPHMLDKYQKLSNLLRGNNVEAGGSSVAPGQHPLGIAFCTDLLARKFVQQGDLLISSNADTAHCYAAVLVALWHDYPDFGKLVLAYFYQTVPYLVPFYPPKISGQSDQEYYISLGYNYIDGIVEKQDKFLKRMSGTMRLYAALTISKLKKGQQGPHPHGLMHAWRWITNILNLEPRSDITAQLIFDFLEVTGSQMQACYGKQFQKILVFINDVYLEKMRKIDSGGPVTRLEVLLDKIKKNGQIDPPKGRLPEGFW